MFQHKTQHCYTAGGWNNHTCGSGAEQKSQFHVKMLSLACAKPVTVILGELCGSGDVSPRARKKSNIHKLIIYHRGRQNPTAASKWNSVILAKLVKHKGRAILIISRLQLMTSLQTVFPRLLSRKKLIASTINRLNTILLVLGVQLNNCHKAQLYKGRVHHFSLKLTILCSMQNLGHSYMSTITSCLRLASAKEQVEITWFIKILKCIKRRKKRKFLNRGV